VQLHYKGWLAAQGWQLHKTAWEVQTTPLEHTGNVFWGENGFFLNIKGGKMLPETHFDACRHQS
jgi:hypothetical protein